MTRITANPVYKNIQVSPNSAILTAIPGNNSSINPVQNKYNGLGGSLDMILTNKESKRLEHGRIFAPGLQDNERIYQFLKNSLPKDKALEYSRQEVESILEIDANVITCVENSAKDLVGITISYPAILIPSIAEKEKWSQQGGFDPKYFNKGAIYNELRAVDSAYQGNGLGKVMMGKLILDSANKEFNQIVLYSIERAYQNHADLGFKDLGLKVLSFPDNDIGRTHLMNLDIDRHKIAESHNVLNKYILK